MKALWRVPVAYTHAGYHVHHDERIVLAWTALGARLSACAEMRKAGCKGVTAGKPERITPRS